MEFGWTKDQEERYEAAVAFAREHLTDDLRSRDEAQEFSPDLWQKCADFGVLGWFMPEEYGGAGLDLVTVVRMHEGIGYGCPDNGLTLGLNGQTWAVMEPLLHFGSEEQKRKYLPGMCSGELLGAHGMSEPEAGSDAFSLKTTAERVEGGYVLNGEKAFIGLSPRAGLCLVFASTNPQAAGWGISAFLVESGFDGYSAPPLRSKMGLRTNPLGNVVLENCFVPEENRLGPEGAGASIFTHSMDYERSFIFTGHVGSMARQLDDCVRYAHERKQYGQSIGAFQSVSNRIANMKLRLETSRLLLYKLAWMKKEGQAAMMDAALAKVHLSESFVANSLDAIRIHGAKGYLSEYEVERDLRDALGGVIYSGTSDIQRNIVARILDR